MLFLLVLRLFFDFLNKLYKNFFYLMQRFYEKKFHDVYFASSILT